jgi:hypothetical protein
MVSAVTEILKVRKNMNDFESNEAMNKISPFLSSVRDSGSKVLMVAATGKAASIIEKSRNKMTDKEVMSAVVKEFPSLIRGFEEQNE